jgi:hypothetical protein
LVLSADPASTSFFSFQVCGSLGILTSTCIPATQWVPPDKWLAFRIVILDTDRPFSATEDRDMVDYVVKGGVLLVTPLTLSNILSRRMIKGKRGESPRAPALDIGSTDDETGIARCFDGFVASEPSGNAVGGTLRLRPFPFPAAGTAPGPLLPQNRPAPRCPAFTISADVPDEEVRIDTAAKATPDHRLILFFVRQQKAGAVAGTSCSPSTELLRMNRDLAFWAVTRPRPSHGTATRTDGESP